MSHIKQEKLREFNKAPLLHLISETNSDAKLWVLKSDVRNYLSTLIDEVDAKAREEERARVVEMIDLARRKLGYHPVLDDLLTKLSQEK